MVEATRPRPDGAAKSKLTGPPLLRFDFVERAVHWANATLFAIVMATAFALYIPPISAAIGRRELVVTIHVYAGLLLPFPLLIGIAGTSWGRKLRADLRRLNRWIPEDRAWLRRRAWKHDRVGAVKQGKFNAGQKLNAAFTGGAILVMVATGSIMHWFNHFPLSWRPGATFVHDWIFIALVITITGHILFALADRESLNAMVTGRISRNWAKKRAPKWLDEDKADQLAAPRVERTTRSDAGRAAAPGAADAGVKPGPSVSAAAKSGPSGAKPGTGTVPGGTGAVPSGAGAVPAAAGSADTTAALRQTRTD